MEDFVYSTYATLCYVFRNVQYYSASIIKINYDVISGIIAFLSEVIRLFVKCTNVTFNIIIALLEASVDFLAECFNFLRAFLQLLWKFVILLFSVLDVVFRGLEQVVYFIWSGGKWTAGTLSASVENVKVISMSIFEYLEIICTFLYENVSSGLYMFGTCSLHIIVGVYNITTWTFFSAASLVDNAMIYFADSVKFVVDSVYDALTNTFPNTRIETYMGILMIVLFYIALVHVVSKLYNRGYTFPCPGNMNHYNVPYPRFGNEFSDDEFGMSADEENNDNESNDTESSRASVDNDEDDDFSDGDDEFSDESSELSVMDESDEENSSHDDDSDDSVEPIDIQLPPECQYNLRRSATPNRQKRKSTQDIEKEMEQEREKQMCVVCQDNKKSVLILPCRHMCLCVDCGNRIARARPLTRRICPLCREKIRTIMNIYL
ncbi:cation channel sperm-associated protein 2-like [Ostrea edulis]|uniref:cation channel sperm-associated protein 2-like n=1 Tax=Ostrea edulis TaxID=37623 RepID=UPI0020940CDB|nr:cation channel sperm-associated protein 2-like [Ostrea edulis]